MVDGRLEKGEATRERLIRAGRELFGEQGYDATSTAAILDAAGTSRGSLYHHFATKEALFDVVVDRVVADIAAEANRAGREARAARPADDPVASLRAGFAVWLGTALDPAVQRIALLDAPAVLGWARLREIDTAHVLGGLRAIMQQLADDGRLPPGDIDVLTHMLLAAVSEAALMIATADDPATALDAARTSVNALLDRLIA